MLADPRSSEALVNDFAAQWLNLRRVDEVVVDPERYPNYDLTLMEAFKRETELFVGSTLREDRSVLELLNADYTFVNEKLAQALRHPWNLRQPLPARVVARQGPARRAARAGRAVVDDVVSGSHVAGSSREISAEQHLRAADAAAAARRRYQSRAGEARRGARRRIRERLAAHRTNPTCASCHAVIDPLGFALENFDVIGGWRTVDEAGKPVDAAGTTMSGANVRRAAWIARPAAGAPRAVPAHRHRKTARLCARAQGRVLRPSCGSQHRARRRGAGFSLVGAHIGNREKSGISDEAIDMFLTSKSLPRRTVLRGLGATLALPFLDAMTPAMALRVAARDEAGASVPRVLRAERHGDGVLVAERRGQRIRDVADPAAARSPSAIRCWCSRASTPTGWRFMPGHPARFSPARPRGGKTEIEIFADTSMDQLLARHHAGETQIASLEMAMDPPANAGACTGNLSCVYTHTLSWRSPTQPLPMEWNPRAVFEKLFGDTGSTDRAAREARLRQHKSLLDSVNEKLASLRTELGPQDRAKVEQYTEAVRDVERRIRARRAASRSRAAGHGPAAGRAAGVRRSPGADARFTAARVSERFDARDLVHARQGAERAAVSADRRARGASSAVASPGRRGAHCAHVEDQPATIPSSSRSIWRSSARRRTAMDRCSIT